MSTSTQQFQLTSRSKLVKGTAAVLAILCVMGASADIANAAKPRPKPQPAPVVLVSPPSIIQVAAAEANRIIASVDSGSGYIVAGEYVSGPTIPGGDIVGGPAIQVFLVDGGNYWVNNLVPNSDYVIRFKRIGFFNSATNTYITVTSNYTTFSFHTPTLEQSRPTAPVISFGQVTAENINVLWNPSTDNTSSNTQIQYVYNASNIVMSSPLLPTCYSYCFGTTGLRIQRPPSGTTLTVFAIDGARNRSLPSNVLVTP